jgi:hypothetical protein
MRSETFTLETTGGAAVVLDPSTVKGQRFSDGHQNAQIQASNLGGGKFSVEFRSPNGSHWVEHVTGASETDTVILAGRQAPIFEALRVSFSNVPAPTVSEITLTTWARGI